ncbi:ras-related and estrogen-regulated growth inhibitor-like isoform X1 [Biomphalaria glabrata]|nr:ras-related and estrogen-regulated growth inhibitor-like isoform X1 [Biomphalaria glabrata]
MNGTRLLKPQHTSETKDVCRVVVLGYPGVGKTALVVRFLTKRFLGEYCPTLESIYRYSSDKSDEDDVRMDILDTAGHADTQSCWNEGYALWGDCFVLVYSITEEISFKEVQNLRHLLEAAKRQNAYFCVLVGNKNDLVYDRQVTTSQGQELADDIGCKFYEVSACEWNQLPQVVDIFIDLHATWRRSKQARDGRPRKSSSSTKFRQAIQKVISGKSSNVKKNDSHQ